MNDIDIESLIVGAYRANLTDIETLAKLSEHYSKYPKNHPNDLARILSCLNDPKVMAYYRHSMKPTTSTLALDQLKTPEIDETTQTQLLALTPKSGNNIPPLTRGAAYDILLNAYQRQTLTDHEYKQWLSRLLDAANGRPYISADLLNSIRFELMLVNLTLSKQTKELENVYQALEHAKILEKNEYEQYSPKLRSSITILSPQGTYVLPLLPNRTFFLSQEIIHYYDIDHHFTSSILAIAFDYGHRLGDWIGYCIGSLIDSVLSIATITLWWTHLKHPFSAEHPWMNTGFTRVLREACSIVFGIIGFFLALPFACIILPIKTLLPESHSEKLRAAIHRIARPLLQYFIENEGKSLTTEGGHPVPQYQPSLDPRPLLNYGTLPTTTSKPTEPTTTEQTLTKGANPCGPTMC